MDWVPLAGGEVIRQRPPTCSARRCKLTSPLRRLLSAGCYTVVDDLDGQMVVDSDLYDQAAGPGAPYGSARLLSRRPRLSARSLPTTDMGREM